ncbi:MAG: DUF885 domain-containing protein [Gemmatimonadota bacterium]|nr:DUF885 domain-containing protein [Gemmatimonadota bacterium]
MSTELDAIVEGYLDLRSRMDPVAATQLGRHDLDGLYADWSATAVREFTAAVRSYAVSLEEVDALSLQDEIDRTAALHSARHDLLVLERERPFGRDPSYYLTHASWGILLLLSRNAQDAPAVAAALLARLRAMPEFLTRAIAALDAPVATFISTARAMVPGFLELLSTDLDDPAIDVSSLDRAGLDEARRAAADALSSFDRVLALRAETAGDDFAIGRDLFDRKLHTAHMMADTADVVDRYGARLGGEAIATLERIAEEIRPGTTWRELIEELRRADPVEETLAGGFASALDAARRATAAAGLVTLPLGDLQVTTTPRFLRPLIPFAAYLGPGPYDESQQGTMFVTAASEGIAAPLASAELASIAVHEGFPGHHLQQLTANRLERSARRELTTPAAFEGWAHYCETLMQESGFIATAEQRLFAAWNLLWRALRIRLDVGLHTRKMTRMEAERVLVDELGMDAERATAEVRRYCAMPTYQLCYAIGRRDILALREDYRHARGDQCSLKGFHDDLLRYGALPIALARWGMGL